MDLQSLPWYGQFLVFLFIGAVAILFFYFMVYSGTQDQINGVVSQIQQLDIEIKTGEKKEGMLDQLKQEVKKREEVLETLKEILPENNEIAGIITKIESLILASNLKVLKWSAPVKRQREIYVEHQLAIDIEGGYHNLGIFFDQMSKIKKIFTIAGLEIKPINKKGNPHVIKASFRAMTFTYFEPKAKPRKKGRASKRNRSRK